MGDSSTATPAAVRHSSEETKDAIRRAGALLFAGQGFATTSVREIAKAAGADPALVIRYFGSKEQLFLETMTVEGAFSSATDGPLGQLGEAILRHLLNGPPSARQAYTALMRAVDRPDVRDYLVRAAAANLIDPLTRRLPGPDARLRASLIAAQVNGLLSSLWILEDPSLSEERVDAVIRLYAPVLQVLVEGPEEAGPTPGQSSGGSISP